MVATLTGTVDTGQDAVGAFGTAGSNLAGATYTASFRYDTSLGERLTDATYDTVAGGIAHGGFTSPILDATLTINGSTQHFASNFNGVVLNQLGGSYNIAYQAQGDSGASFSDLTFTIQSATLPPFNLETPYQLSLAGPSGAFSFYNNLTSTAEYSGTLIATSLNVQLGSSPASVLELARASSDVYNTTPGVIGDFVPGHTWELPDGLRVRSYSSPDGSHIILSIRGTENDPSKNDAGAKNFLVDYAVASGIRNSLSEQYLKEASEILASVASDHPGVQIQLTGHSLGGAIAQVLGGASGLQTTVFDAPGAGDLRFFQAEQLNVPVLGNFPVGTNYRAFGDQVSLVGIQIGPVVTVGDASSVAFGPKYFVDFGGVEYAHSIDLLSLLLAANAPEAGGFYGAEYWNYAQSVVSPILGTFGFFAAEGTHYFPDPAGYDTFTFNGLSGSPFFDSVMLPSLEGVSLYRLSYFADGAWSPYVDLLPLQAFGFGDGVSAFRFSALDDYGAPVTLQDFFLIDVTFGSSGYFAGSIVGSSEAKVPEPETWLLLVVGFACLGGVVRRHARGRQLTLKTPASALV